MGHRATVVETVKTVARTSYEQHVQYPAAALAYYGFVSLVPLLVLLVAAVGAPTTGPFRTAAFRFLTPEAQRLVARALTDSTGRVGAILFAVLVLVWSGANITAGFQTVVKRVERSTDRSLVGKVRDAVGILGPLGLGIGAVVLTNVFLPLSPGAPYAVVGAYLVLFVALTVVFLLLYYVSSRSVTSLRMALPGSIVAALGWTVLLVAVRVYVVNAASFAIYGVLSVILLVLTSLYAAAAALMVGLVVNATLADGAATP